MRISWQIGARVVCSVLLEVPILVSAIKGLGIKIVDDQPELVSTLDCVRAALPRTGMNVPDGPSDYGCVKIEDR